MLHTQIKLSEIKSQNSDEFDFASKIIALHSIDGAAQAAEQNGEECTVAHMNENLNFKWLVDFYTENIEEDLVLYSANPYDMRYHDELFIDSWTENDQEMFKALKIKAYTLVKPLVLETFKTLSIDAYDLVNPLTLETFCSEALI